MDQLFYGHVACHVVSQYPYQSHGPVQCVVDWSVGASHSGTPGPAFLDLMINLEQKLNCNLRGCFVI